MMMSSTSRTESDDAWGQAQEQEASALIERALAEDLPAGDLTSDSLFPAGPDVSAGGGAVVGAGVVARCVFRQEGVFCGGPVAGALFEKVDPAVKVEVLAAEGSRVEPGAAVLELSGPCGSVLRGERALLNFLQRLCGISTWTALWVKELDGMKSVLLDTRKTTPGWRRLEKYAVRMGGAVNHRFDLSDGIMLKDNHRWVLRKAGGSTLADWVATLRESSPGTFLQVEVDSRQEYLEALEVAGIDSILLDNFPPGELSWAVEEKHSRQDCDVLLEASGGISLENVREVAATGVERISVGALTHSATALDVSLEMSEVFSLEQKL